MYFIGLMSGTSADGVDASIIKFNNAQFTSIANLGISFDENFRQNILALYQTSNNEIERQSKVAHQLAQLYAQTIYRLLTQAELKSEQIVAIGCHGQTIRHRPNFVSPYSLQITDYAKLAELTGIDVIGDFRAADIAAGGQGAPLVPAFHQALFQAYSNHKKYLLSTLINPSEKLLYFLHVNIFRCNSISTFSTIVSMSILTYSCNNIKDHLQLIIQLKISTLILIKFDCFKKSFEVPCSEAL